MYDDNHEQRPKTALTTEVEKHIKEVRSFKAKTGKNAQSQEPEERAKKAHNDAKLSAIFVTKFGILQIN